MAALRVIAGSRGIATQVVVRQTELDDLIDEVSALEAEAVALAARALPLARQLAVIALAMGPRSGLIGEELVALLERVERRHTPRAAA